MNGTVLLVGYLDGTISLWRQNDETTTDINDPDNEQVLAIACNRYSADVFAIRSLQVINKTLLHLSDRNNSPNPLDIHGDKNRQFYYGTTLNLSLKCSAKD